MKPKPVLIARKMPDRRHMPVKGFLDEYWQREMPSIPSLPWGAADAGALAQFLRANPDLAVEQIRECLMNRLASEDHAPGERVHVWIGSLLRYAQGPLDRFKLPKRQTPSEATVGMYRPSQTHTEPAPSAPIRQTMGERWFKRMRERWESGKALCDMDRDCLREEGLL